MLFEVRRSQISVSFQSLRKRAGLQRCFRVLYGWDYSLAGVSDASVLNPTLSMEMAQHNAAIEQREADPQAVQGEEG